jgi:spermidine synthase
MRGSNILKEMKEETFTYKDGKLVNEYGQSVMMEWETPLMEKVANIITSNGGDILNIGFGMGIVDSFIQKHKPKSHTIIEYHPDVINYIKQSKWDERANFIFSKWQEQIGKIGQFDGIYLDTWNDYTIPHINEFLDKHLKLGGTYCMWYNEFEFDRIRKDLPSNYVVRYEYLINDNLIPSAKEQYEKSGYYIDPNSEKITIPIITKIK